MKLYGSTKHTFWYGRGWTPVHVGFCLSERAWNEDKKRMGHGVEYPTFQASATFFERGKGHGACVIITMDPAHIADATIGQIMALAAHECVHYKQYAEGYMIQYEKRFDIETEAYMVQGILQEIWYTLEKLKTRPKKNKK